MNHFFGNADNQGEKNNPMDSMNPMRMMPFSYMMNPMNCMRQAFFMQLQFMQNMTRMQLQLMQSLMSFESVDTCEDDVSTAAKASDTAQQEGFKLGDLTVPPELLKKLMQMDMTPENLEKLQKMLDFVLGSVPASKDK